MTCCGRNLARDRHVEAGGVGHRQARAGDEGRAPVAAEAGGCLPLGCEPTRGDARGAVVMVACVGVCRGGPQEPACPAAGGPD